MMYRRIAAGVVSSMVAATSAHAGYQTIALLGDEAPDTGGATYGNLLGTISVDDAGDVTFWSTLNGVSSDFSSAAFRSVDGVIEKIIQKGEEPPGMPGKTLRQVGGPNYSASGTLAINLRLDFNNKGVTFDNDWGLWLDSGAGLELIAQEGSEAPQTGGGLFDRPGEPILSPGGDLAFLARLKNEGEVNSDNDGVLWRRRAGGSLGLLAREGSSAPGVEGGVFQFVNTPSINSSGETAFSGSLVVGGAARRGGIDFSNNSGIWVADAAGKVDLAIRAGDDAVGVEGFVFNAFFTRPLINESGDLAVIANMTDPNADARGFGNSGIWASSEGELAKIASTEDLAPGAGGSNYRSFLWSAFNDNGDVAFGAYLDEPKGMRGVGPPEGLWRYSDGAIDTIAITGDTAPETGGAAFQSFASPVMNNRGDVVFQATLAIEGDVTFDTASGIWAFAAPGNGRGVGSLIKVARTGDDFEVAPGDVRVIDFVDVQGSGVEAFEPTPALNDSGLLAIRLGFTDGSVGVFLFQVPAPGSVLLFAMAGAMGTRRRR